MHTLATLAVAVASPPRLLRFLSTISPSPAVDFVSTGEQPTHTAAEAAAALGLEDASTVVKSLVCTASTGKPILVLASGSSRVDMKKVGRWANCRVRLATPSEVQACTGHVAGEVPPLCADASDTLSVLMDSRVLDLGSTVYAGAGEPGLHLRTSPAELLRASCAVVGDFTVAATAEASAAAEAAAASAAAPLPAALAPPEPASSAEERGLDQRAGGPSARPLRSDVAAVLAARPLADGLVELPRCEVLRVRRQARLLLFATLRVLAPPRKAADGSPLKLPAGTGDYQLIVGKSFVRSVGEEEAHARMRRVRAGSLLRARGRLQLNPRLTGPDLVACELELLASPQVEAQKEPQKEPQDAPSVSPPQKQGTPETRRAAASAEERPFSSPPLRAPKRPPRVLSVQDGAGIAALSAALDEAVSRGEPVAFDCEWRPRNCHADPSDDDGSLQLLQLATRREAFVVDVAAFASPGAEESRSELRRCLLRLLRAEESEKLGFASGEDLRRLETSLPGVTEGAANMRDLQRAATRAVGSPRRTVVGLAGACEALLRASLDKSRQSSDWAARPLSAEQLEYAALDAFVLLELEEELSRLALLPPSPPRGDARASVALARESPPPARTSSPQPPPSPPSLAPVSSRALPLSGLEAMLSSYVGLPLGGRRKVLRLCAAGSAAAEEAQLDEREITSAGGGGLTLWGDGSACFYINSQSSRPGAKYRNQFWREGRGELAGEVLFAWYFGRDQRLSDGWVQPALRGEVELLLFCRPQTRSSRRPYRFCGRIRAAAVALPPGEEGVEGAEGWPPVWSTDGAAHVVWRLVDADALIESTHGAFEDVFGPGGGIAPMRPRGYGMQERS